MLVAPTVCRARPATYWKSTTLAFPPCRPPRSRRGASSRGPRWSAWPSAATGAPRRSRALGAPCRVSAGVRGRSAAHSKAGELVTDREQAVRCSWTCICSAGATDASHAGRRRKTVRGVIIRAVKLIEVREEVRPAGAFRLTRRAGMDGVLRRPRRLLERLLQPRRRSRSWVRVAQTATTGSCSARAPPPGRLRPRHRTDAITPLAGRRGF